MDVQASADVGCAIKPVINASPKIVSVNGVIIDRQAIAQETQNHSACEPIIAWRAAARALVIRELLMQEARAQDIIAEPLEDAEGRRETEDEALTRQLIEREIITPKATEAECQHYYERNQARFRSADLYEARHILFAAQGDAAKRQEISGRAKEISVLLAAAPQEFDAFANAFSDCPSGKTGGNLGQLGPGQTVPEFEAALSIMTPGVIHPELVETRYGWHIIALDQRIEGRILPFALVREKIALWLDERVQRAAVKQYLGLLAARATIVGVTLDDAVADSVRARS